MCVRVLVGLPRGVRKSHGARRANRQATLAIARFRGEEGAGAADRGPADGAGLEERTGGPAALACVLRLSLGHGVS